MLEKNKRFYFLHVVGHLLVAGIMLLWFFKGSTYGVILLLTLLSFDALYYVLIVRGIILPEGRQVTVYEKGLEFLYEPKWTGGRENGFVSFKQIKTLRENRKGELAIHCLFSAMGRDYSITSPEHHQRIIEAFANFKNGTNFPK